MSHDGNRTHGHTNGKKQSLTYRSWMAMRQRCYVPTNAGYKNYGAKGIRVCERWRHSFQNFLADMGERASRNMTIDRLDATKDYFPANCKWSTYIEQANHKSNNHFLTHGGETLSIHRWAAKLGLFPQTIRRRIYNYGWTIEQALDSKRYTRNKRSTA